MIGSTTFNENRFRLGRRIFFFTLKNVLKSSPVDPENLYLAAQGGGGVGDVGGVGGVDGGAAAKEERESELFQTTANSLKHNKVLGATLPPPPPPSRPWLSLKVVFKQQVKHPQCDGLL